MVLDSRTGLRLVADHLHAFGHCRVAYLGLDEHRWTFDQRRRHWADAVGQVWGASEIQTVEARDLTLCDATLAGLELLSGPDRPTAVVCADDILAAGVYAAAAQLGVSIPRQLSVVGYGGTLVGGALLPAMTTVLTPAEDLGARGVELLIEQLRGREIPLRTVLPVELAVRASVGRPRRT